MDDAETVAWRFYREFNRLVARDNPLWSLFYEIEITEVEVWPGSRCSKCSVCVKKRGGGIRKFAGAVVTTLGLLSMDPQQIPENIEWLLHNAEQIVEMETYELEISDIEVYFDRNRVPPPYRRRDGEYKTWQDDPD